MKRLAIDLGIDYAAQAPLARLHAIRDGVRVNRIRYPEPNVLGLSAPIRGGDIRVGLIGGDRDDERLRYAVEHHLPTD